MKKIEMAKKLKELVNNVDEKAFLESEHKMYYIVNRKRLLKLTPEQMAYRSSKEGLEFMIRLYNKFQLGGN